MADNRLFTEMLIIGAGPYGLAVASYAKQANISFRLMGTMLDFFENHTPRPMVMATSYETAIKDPKREMTLRRYCTLKGIPVPDAPGQSPTQFPPRQLFLSYAHWWVTEMGLDADPRHVTTLNCRNGGFEAVLEDGATVQARKVVVATGMYPHRFIPPLYRERLPVEMYSHNTDAVSLEAFASKRVLVVGGGFSGVEWAIYLTEAGAEATCIYRGEWVSTEQGFAVTVFKWRDLSETDYLWWQRLTPEEREQNLHLMKIQHRNGVPPWLRGREGKVRFFPRTDVQDCQERGGHIQVTLTNGKKMEVDHIILGTGFKPDIANLAFLDRATFKSRLRPAGGFPALDEHFQSTVPGLYFSGALAIEQFGPVLWFVSGSGIAPPHIFKHILSKNV
jgi:thioredoxin reductase